MIDKLIISHFEDKIAKFPINWNNLSRNPKLRWEFIKNHLDKPWDWKVLTHHPAITLDIIKNNKNLPWDYSELFVNNKSIINSKEIENEVSSTSGVDWNFIIENINKNWDWGRLSNHKIPINILKILINKNIGLYWHNLTNKYSDDEISSNISMNWIWNNIFEERSKERLEIFFQDINNIPEEILEKIVNDIHYNQKIWNKIPWKLIIKYHDIYWNWEYFSNRNDLSLEYLIMFPKKEWNWKTLSKNPIITWDFVSSHTNYSWDYTYLSINENITFDIINKNPFNDWKLEVFQYNPNFLLSDEDLINIIKKNHAICIIQRQWKICNANPNFKICKERLKSEFNNILLK